MSEDAAWAEKPAADVAEQNRSADPQDDGLDQAAVPADAVIEADPADVADQNRIVPLPDEE